MKLLTCKYCRLLQGGVCTKVNLPCSPTGSPCYHFESIEKRVSEKHVPEEQKYETEDYKKLLKIAQSLVSCASCLDSIAEYNALSRAIDELRVFLAK